MKPLTDLKPRECRWPVETHGKDHLFCGEPASEGPYCACHRRLAYKPGSALKLSAGALDRLSDALDGRRYRRRASEGERGSGGGMAALSVDHKMKLPLFAGAAR